MIAVEITSAGTDAGTGRFAQFLIGRLIVYISVGLVEVDVT
jgi:MFS transporter, SP family, sugar:H+ symporter